MWTIYKDGNKDKIGVDFMEEDILIIKNKGHRITREELNSEKFKQENYLDLYTTKCDYKTGKRTETGIFNLKDIWFDDMLFDGSRVYVLTSFVDKLRYVYASLHEDELVNKIVCSLLDGIHNVEVTSRRYTRENYMLQWMGEYKFSIEDFLLDSRYVVISGSKGYNEFAELADLGLVKWKNIKHCWGFEDEYSKVK